MQEKTVLVTGGAGYIGSHVVKQLGEAGYQVVVYDNCSTGSADAVLYGELIRGDLADQDRLYQLFAQYQFSAVLHFAASLVVPESVIRPLDYYTNNTRNTLNLLRCCAVAKIQHFIFSSTAAVYGEPEIVPVTEQATTLPINPYGRSKLMSEWLIRDAGSVSSMRSVILRYFNVAGADSSGQLGQNAERAEHLIRAACDTALKRKPCLKIFGTDFDTPDGTAIRDYIHVEDLASAHLAALRYLEQGGESQTLNCGYGRGYSVRQVVERVKAISGVDFPVVETDRRIGDPACVTACVDRIRATLDWTPQYDDLDTIVKSTLDWEKRRPSQPDYKYLASDLAVNAVKANGATVH
ncbi:MAG: UDP-glucose 4-epimerase GalE [Leptolyngbya sp. Prado105]|nr:UDP-glucose 4-epimerase GalE [Leptolyngbya sp. Prado105]